MNTIIINCFGKLITIITVFILSLTNLVNLDEFRADIRNNDKNKILKDKEKPLKYETIKEYSDKVPKGIENIKIKGVNGVLVLDETGEYKVFKDKIDEVIVIGTGKEGIYTGMITGYGPDCKTCDGRGYVNCPLLDGTWFSLSNNGIYYNDSQFGDVRILAADHREFPCGTIIEVSNENITDPIIGIVLDTGSAMKKAYNNGTIHIDLAFETEQGLKFETNKNTSFVVRRWGW
ncbi:MAG: hypothetical protein II309_07360 [Bacilli bacterium]|nr:hypothetical protein [Bacilli bacterium]